MQVCLDPPPVYFYGENTPALIFLKIVSEYCFSRLFLKIVSQKLFSRLFLKIVSQDCFSRLFLKIVIQNRMAVFLKINKIMFFESKQKYEGGMPSHSKLHAFLHIVQAHGIC